MKIVFDVVFKRVCIYFYKKVSQLVVEILKILFIFLQFLCVNFHLIKVTEYFNLNVCFQVAIMKQHLYITDNESIIYCTLIYKALVFNLYIKRLFESTKIKNQSSFIFSDRKEKIKTFMRLKMKMIDKYCIPICQHIFFESTYMCMYPMSSNTHKKSQYLVLKILFTRFSNEILNDQKWFIFIYMDHF